MDEWREPFGDLPIGLLDLDRDALLDVLLAIGEGEREPVLEDLPVDLILLGELERERERDRERDASLDRAGDVPAERLLDLDMDFRAASGDFEAARESTDDLDLDLDLLALDLADDCDPARCGEPEGLLDIDFDRDRDREVLVFSGDGDLAEAGELGRSFGDDPPDLESYH